MRKKNIIYSLIVLALMLIVYQYRKATQSEPQRLIELRGPTMGTTYQIKYIGSRVMQKEVDSLLVAFNQSLSTYIPESEISVFNQQDSFSFQSPYFLQVIQGSKKIYEMTEGAFDPTVLPLVKAWGFGPKKDSVLKDPNLDSLLAYIGFDKISFDEKNIHKKKSGIQLDFNAIAQGQSTDVIAAYLEKNGVSRYMIEIGGEVICKGKNPSDELWSIGIENPYSEEKGGDKIFAIVNLENAALATSGNYRKFYIRDGKKYPHTINPKTGRPVEHSLLSATVVTASCMDADALATSFMVMGKDKAIEFVKKHADIHIFLIYEENGKLQTYMSDGMMKMIKK